MDSSGIRASRESTEGFSSEEEGDCDVFLSDSDSDKPAEERAPRPGRPRGRDGDGSAFIGGVPAGTNEGGPSRPQASIPHPMSAGHLKKPLENIYFASASVGQPGPFPTDGGLEGDWDLRLGGHLATQHPSRCVSRVLKRNWSGTQGSALAEGTPRAVTRGDLLFAHKCKELQAFIRPLSVLLNGLKTGRYNKGLTSFQQSVAMDRIQRIVGVLQKPEMGERYLGTLLQVEMMLKVWFPHVTTATPSSTGSGPTETECSARKHTRTSSSGTSSSRNSSSPPSSPRQSCSDGSSGETSVAGAGRGQAGESEERPEEEEEEEEDEEQEGRPGSGPAWLEGQEDAASGLRCLPLVTQDSSISSTTRPRLSRTLPQPWDSFDLRESGRPSK